MNAATKSELEKINETLGYINDNLVSIANILDGQLPEICRAIHAATKH